MLLFETHQDPTLQSNKSPLQLHTGLEEERKKKRRKKEINKMCTHPICYPVVFGKLPHLMEC